MMRIIDFVYYIAYHAYLRGNKSSSGSFLIVSLWFSMFQFMLLFILLTILELLINVKLLFVAENIFTFFTFLLLIVLINNLYLHLGKGKGNVLSRYNLKVDKQKKYWMAFSILFFVVFILSGILANLRIGHFTG
ncbi:MAG: hypothetical protein ACOCVN_00885 [bacterium]